MIPLRRCMRINAGTGFIFDFGPNHFYKALKINSFTNLQIFKFPNYFRIFATPK